jgi:hypothetical protein
MLKDMNEKVLKRRIDFKNAKENPLSFLATPPTQKLRVPERKVECR